MAEELSPAARYVASLQKRIQELEAALERYGAHNSDHPCGYGDVGEFACTCGFDAVKKGIRE